MDVQLIKNLTQVSTSERFLSVFLTQNKSHVGIIYKLQDSNLKYLHFLSKIKQDSTMPSTGFFCGFLNDPNDAYLIQSLITKLASIDEGDYINYGFNVGDEIIWWNLDAEFNENETQHLGLTCATFVWIVLRDLGYPTCLFNTWPPRSCDQIWQEDLVSQGCVSPEPITGIRLRPIEAMACAISPQPPVDFNDASIIVSDIEARIAQLMG